MALLIPKKSFFYTVRNFCSILKITLPLHREAASYQFLLPFKAKFRTFKTACNDNVDRKPPKSPDFMSIYIPAYFSGVRRLSKEIIPITDTSSDAPTHIMDHAQSTPQLIAKLTLLQ